MVCAFAVGMRSTGALPGIQLSFILYEFCDVSEVDAVPAADLAIFLSTSVYISPFI